MKTYIYQHQEYFVCKRGLVFKGDNLLSQYDNGSGYKVVVLSGKPHYIHKLLAKLYVPNPENKLLVYHKNGNVQDNRIINLGWTSSAILKQNDNHIANKWKPGRGHVRPIRIINSNTGETVQSFDSMTIAAKVMDVPPKSIWQAINTLRLYKGYKWTYA